MVDIKTSGQTLWRFNAMPNQALGIRIPWFNGQDQIVWSGNYCCSSIKVTSVDENKNIHRKITKPKKVENNKENQCLKKKKKKKDLQSVIESLTTPCKKETFKLHFLYLLFFFFLE